MEMDELDLLYKTRLMLKEKGFVVLKEPVQEFYRNLFKFTGIGLGGLLNMAGKSAGQIAGKLLKELASLLETGTVSEIKRWEVTDKGVIVGVKGSVFSASQDSKKPMCIPLQGGFAGVMEAFFGGRWSCKEIECESMGEDTCTFEIRRE
ncbi:V4R domain-containing protein [Hydrogenobacter thermophilus]|nr:V4R domain-containing protein [Hydrogenobacter thermophilus]